MNVADKDLCQELYEVSGWSDTHLRWNQFMSKEAVWQIYESSEKVVFAGYVGYAPAYDLGYVLCKLHRATIHHKWVDGESTYTARISVAKEHKTSANTVYKSESETPENAAVKLAIELFKQGILKR